MIKSNLGKNLLRFFVITLILVYGFSLITEYNTLKPIVADFSTKLVSGNLPMVVSAPGMRQNISQQITGSITEYCKTNDKFAIPGYESSTVDCGEVRAKGPSALSEFITDMLMKDYYKNYDCSPVGCLLNIYFGGSSGDVMFIFSKKMNDFLKLLTWFLVFGVSLGVVIIAHRIREKFGIFKEVGTTLLGAAGIPFLILLFIIYKDQILVRTGILSGKEAFMSTTTNFFSGPIYNVVNLYAYLYGVVFVIGAVLAITGHYGLKKNPKASENYQSTKSPRFPNIPSAPIMGQYAEIMKSLESSQKSNQDLKNPEEWDRRLNQWLAEDYRDLLFNLDDMQVDAKIPHIKERLLRKIEMKRNLMRDANIQQSMMPEKIREMLKVKTDSERKYLLILEKLATDIRMQENAGKSGEEILEHVRKTLLS